MTQPIISDDMPPSVWSYSKADLGTPPQTKSLFYPAIAAIGAVATTTGTAIATLAIAATHNVTTVAATALLVKGLGLTALGTVGGIGLIYGLPLIILIAALIIIALKPIENDKITLLDRIKTCLEKQKYKPKVIQDIMRRLFEPDVTFYHLRAILNKISSNKNYGKRLMDALNFTPPSYDQDAARNPKPLTQKEKQLYSALLDLGILGPVAIDVVGQLQNGEFLATRPELQLSKEDVEAYQALIANGIKRHIAIETMIQSKEGTLDADEAEQLKEITKTYVAQISDLPTLTPAQFRKLSH